MKKLKFVFLFVLLHIVRYTYHIMGGFIYSLKVLWLFYDNNCRYELMLECDWNVMMEMW